MSERLAQVEAGASVAGRYTLEQRLGRGGMGQVWRATDNRLGRDVAVKLLAADHADELARQRFEREARTAAALSHAAIVAVHDVGTTEEGVPFLVMELAEGDTLADVIARGPLSTADIIAIAIQICDALQAAHAAAVIHRDIKPENILLTGGGRVKVCDFGIATYSHPDSDTLTEPGKAMGTAQFMSPEQARGHTADHRADLYALGCVIYAMATGHPPFPGNTPAHVAWQHIHQPVAPLSARRPSTPPQLDNLVNQLLAKDPQDRPSSAAAVAETLQGIDFPAESTPAWAGRAVVNTPPPTRQFTQLTSLVPAARPAADHRRAWVIATLAAVLTVTAVVLAVAANRNSGGPSAHAPAASSPAAAPAASAPPAADPATALAALDQAISANAGHMNKDAVKELTEKTRDIREALAKGQAGKAADKIADLQKKLAELRREDKISDTGYAAIEPAMTTLAAALPPARDDDD